MHVTDGWVGRERRPTLNVLLISLPWMALQYFSVAPLTLAALVYGPIWHYITAILSQLLYIQQKVIKESESFLVT